MLAALNAEERQDLIMSVGVHAKRRRATPIRLTELIEKALKSETLEEIAKHVNLQGTTILRKLLSLKDLPPEVQSLVNWGQREGGISFSVAAEIVRLARASDRLELARLAIEQRLSKSEVQAVVQRTIREQCCLSDALKEILRLRTNVEQHFLFVGLLNGEVDNVTARRNIRRNLSRLIGARNILAVKCKDGRFSLVVNEIGANSENVRPFLGSDKLQSFVNSIAAE